MSCCEEDEWDDEIKSKIHNSTLTSSTTAGFDLRICSVIFCHGAKSKSFSEVYGPEQTSMTVGSLLEVAFARSDNGCGGIRGTCKPE